MVAADQLDESVPHLSGRHPQQPGEHGGRHLSHVPAQPGGCWTGHLCRQSSNPDPGHRRAGNWKHHTGTTRTFLLPS